MAQLCLECRSLLTTQSIRLHDSLQEVKHVHNNTLYACNCCHAQIALTSVPHQWVLMNAKSSQKKVA
ncbi:hypothetical protein [Aliamphritea ceti]|uniref:hypothetical protein n=1 Tax=Aliamphritea ceti TaxID=1524258 RepID=UPI0021C2B763|nr:hypothetical protein [Aliamphritea ceti]